MAGPAGDRDVGQLEELAVSLPANAGDHGKLFGAVTAADIVLAVKKAGGPAVDKRSVEIAKPIKSVGSHTVGLKLTSGVVAHINVDEAGVLTRLRARAANTLAVSRVERRVEIATKGIEPRSRRLKVLDGAKGLQRRQRRQLSDGQIRECR